MMSNVIGFYDTQKARLRKESNFLSRLSSEAAADRLVDRTPADWVEPTYEEQIEENAQYFLRRYPKDRPKLVARMKRSYLTAGPMSRATIDRVLQLLEQENHGT